MEMNAFEAEVLGEALKIFNPADSGASMTLIGAGGVEMGRLAPGSWLGVPGVGRTASVTWLELPIPRQPFLRRLRLALRMVFTGR